MSPRRADKDRLGRKVRIGRLLDAYGVLLTERQREFVRLHHNEDMSFGEIASEYGISRQAVHDAVRQAEAAMEQYESGLELLKRGGGGRALPAEAPPGRRQTAHAHALKALIAELEVLRQRLAMQGIIYDAAEYVRALDDVVDRLRDILPE